MSVFDILGNLMYLALFLQALWGFYCVVLVWMRVDQKRFKDEEQQRAFLEAIEEPLAKGDYETVQKICEGDRRAVVQLVQMAVENRALGYAKVKQLLSDRFQRDILSDIDNALSWVYSMIKTAPMIGLLGTVMGMMSAFRKLSIQKNVEPDLLAKDIQLALITTACGLTIAVPLLLATSSINIKIKRMQDLVTYGLNQFLEIFREALIRHPK
jgi:biopolymer transport protein ExbB/TolQ